MKGEQNAANNRIVRQQGTKDQDFICSLKAA
jgi:hypothetical protein